MNKTVLIVDDEEVLRKAMVYLFRRAGYEVISAGSGNEAFAIVCRQHVDIIISDVQMPNGSGIDLIREVKRRNPDLPMIIFITAFADLTSEEAYDLGAYAILTKPFEKEDLMAKVKQSLEPEMQLAADREGARDPKVYLLSGQVDSFNMGRGGVCVSLAGKSIPDTGAFVDFEISANFAGEPATLRGSGVVRWVKITGRGEIRVGLEFLEMDRASRNLFVEWKRANRPVPFIPKSI